MRMILAALVLAFTSGMVHAADATCADKAAEKKLAGAAKNSFVKKCEKDSGAVSAAEACAAKAVDKNGKPLAGAAKNSFVKKCEKDAK
jgi:hypothetical protein